MRYLQMRVGGRWAHFRKPETNNNPLTHDFITKTALIGLVGAVLGVQRSEWRAQFPILSSDLLYGVAVNNAVRKESWGFTLRSAFNRNDLSSRAPRAMELLRDPSFTIVLALRSEASAEVFGAFERFVREGLACYPPVLGLHSCPAEIEWLDAGEAQEGTGDYETRGFALREGRLQMPLSAGTRIGFERIPTRQTDDWWNPPQDYREVVYPAGGGTLGASGEHWRLEDGGAWCLL